jgi:hypothetical protein
MARVLSALPGHWLRDPCHAANHGCYHHDGRDPIAFHPRSFDTSCGIILLFLSSSLWTREQWASHKLKVPFDISAC